MVIYYYLRLVSAILKMLEHGCLDYYILVCSGKIHFYDSQKFILETCSEKPEVDKMIASLVFESQVFQ